MRPALIAPALHGSGLRVGVYKPVASGCEWQRRRIGFARRDFALDRGRQTQNAGGCLPAAVCRAVAPHLAARAEGRRVDAKLLRSGIECWRETSDIVLVEGAGGLMSPISDEDYNADLAAAFGYPLVVVAANELRHNQCHAADIDYRNHLWRRTEYCRCRIEFAASLWRMTQASTVIPMS